MNLSYEGDYGSPGEQITSLCWSPDSTYIAWGAIDNNIYIWDVKAKRLYAKWKAHITVSTYGGVYTLSWSPDGKYLVSGGVDYVVRVWTKEGKEFAVYRGHVGELKKRNVGGLRCVSWSPDSSQIATAATDNTVHVLGFDTLRVLGMYRHHTKIVNSLAWSPDSKYVASASIDGTVALWERPAKKAFGVPNIEYSAIYREHFKPLFIVAWSPDGTYLASVDYDDYNIHVWKRTWIGTSTLWKYNGKRIGIGKVVWSPNGKLLVSLEPADHLIYCCDAMTGKEVWKYVVPRLPGGSQREPTVLAWAANGPYLAIGTKKHGVHVIKVSSP